MGILDGLRSYAGNAVGALGSAFGAPEFGISENIAGVKGQTPGLNTVPYGTNFGAGGIIPLANAGGQTAPPAQLPSIEMPSIQNKGGAVLGTATDPYAKYGGADKYNALVASMGAQKGSILDATNASIGSAGAQRASSIQDLLDSLKQQQHSIDTSAVNNDLAYTQGRQNVAGMVGRGIKSGGVMLANKNASDSSATQAIADAYGQTGRAQLSNIGNQFAQNQNQIDTQQQNLGQLTTTNLRHLEENKVGVVNNIVETARNSLAALDSAIAGASLPDRINIEQEKEAIRQKALTQLQQYDQMLNQGVAGIHPLDAGAARAQAAELAQKGTAPESAFNYSADTPAQFQGTGPFSSPLPLFTLPGKRQNA